MKRHIAFAAVAVVAVGACSNLPHPTDAAQTVYTLEAGYEAALSAAVAYRNLPRCGVGVAGLCHDPVIVARLVTADNIAHAAILGVEGVVRAGGTGSDVADAMAVAQKALEGLQAVVTSLPARKV